MPFFITSEIPIRELFPGVNAKLIHTDSVTVAHVTLDKGSGVTEHSHMHEQIINVIEGIFEVTVNGETKTVSAGHVAVVPSNVKHSLIATTSGKFLTSSVLCGKTRGDFKDAAFAMPVSFPNIYLYLFIVNGSNQNSLSS